MTSLPLRPKLRVITLTMELGVMKRKRGNERFCFYSSFQSLFRLKSQNDILLGEVYCAPGQSKTIKELVTVIYKFLSMGP